jgi:hypothetical protein
MGGKVRKLLALLVKKRYKYWRRRRGHGRRREAGRYSVYLLYWYKSANIDAAVAVAGSIAFRCSTAASVLVLWY